MKRIKFHALQKIVSTDVRAAYCGCRTDQNQFLNILPVEEFRVKPNDADVERCDMCFKLLRMSNPVNTQRSDVKGATSSRRWQHEEPNDKRPSFNNKGGNRNGY